MQHVPIREGHYVNLEYMVEFARDIVLHGEEKSSRFRSQQMVDYVLKLCSNPIGYVFETRILDDLHLLFKCWMTKVAVHRSQLYFGKVA